jgi:hypothetical protein
MVESSALESADLLLELGQIVLDDLPDDFKIQTKVVVNNSVSQSGNLRPGNLCVNALELFRQLAGSFADYFQIAGDTVYDEFISKKRLMIHFGGVTAIF